MLQIGPEQITPELKALFHADDPASLRCFAVLDGHAAGLVWADSPVHPLWAIVQEAGFGTIYLGGLPDTAILTVLITEFRQTGDVLIGLSHEDARFELLPPYSDYTGQVLEFTNRPIGEGLERWLDHPPMNCEVRCIDSVLFERCLERELLVHIFGSPTLALANGVGVCLMRGEQIVSEAQAGPAAQGLIEIGTMTHERYRERGYATYICAYLLRLCELQGYQTYWNCAKQNRASVALAHKLGYRTTKEYELRAWFGPG